jgi:hypothetical protein
LREKHDRKTEQDEWAINIYFYFIPGTQYLEVCTRNNLNLSSDVACGFSYHVIRATLSINIHIETLYPSREMLDKFEGNPVKLNAILQKGIIFVSMKMREEENFNNICNFA